MTCTYVFIYTHTHTKIHSGEITKAPTYLKIYCVSANTGEI